MAGRAVQKCLTRVDDLELMCQETLAWILRLLGVRGCSIFLQQPAIKQLALVATDPKIPNVRGVGKYRLGEGLTGWVALHGRALILKDTDNHEELAVIAGDLRTGTVFREAIDRSDVRGHESFLAVPFYVDRRVGVLRLTVKEDGADFSDSDRSLLQDIADRLASAIYTAEREQKTKREEPLAHMGEMLSEFRHLTRASLQKLTGIINIWEKREGPADLYHALAIMGGEVRALTAIAAAVDRAPADEFDIVDLRKLMNKAAGGLRADHPHIKLEWFGAKTPIYIEGNAGEIEQVLNLVIGNAVEAMPAAGAVLALEANSGRDCVTVTCRDNGRGMDDTTLKRAFDPMFTTKEGNGRGFGLTTALNIMHRHKGSINLNSELGNGTTVELAFPSLESAHNA